MGTAFRRHTHVRRSPFAVRRTRARAAGVRKFLTGGHIRRTRARIYLFSHSNI